MSVANGKILLMRGNEMTKLIPTIMFKIKKILVRKTIHLQLVILSDNAVPEYVLILILQCYGKYSCTPPGNIKF